ncbi:MAG: hypothetical protein ACM3MF_06180, partial [Anaerolineae bacterium]
ELAALLGLLGLFFTARYAALARGIAAAPLGVGGPQTDLQSGLAIYRFVGVLFYASLAALVAADDMHVLGIQMWLLRGVRRPKLLLIRLLLMLLCGWLLTIAATLGSIGEGALARMIFAGASRVTSVPWAVILAATLAVFWGAVPYMAVTFLLAVACRSALTGVGGTLVFRSILENGLLRLVGRVPALVRLLPVQLAGALEHSVPGMHLPVEAHPQGLYLTSPQAALVIAAMLFVSGVLSIMIFRRQDWGG